MTFLLFFHICLSGSLTHKLSYLSKLHVFVETCMTVCTYFWQVKIAKFCNYMCRSRSILKYFVVHRIHQIMALWIDLLFLYWRLLKTKATVTNFYTTLLLMRCPSFKQKFQTGWWSLIIFKARCWRKVAIIRTLLEPAVS